jgi:acetyl-CoA acetyltransferase
MPEAVIINAVRTPIGALGGVLSPIRPDDLAALVLRAIIDRTGIDPAMVEEVYLGCANQTTAMWRAWRVCWQVFPLKSPG